MDSMLCVETATEACSLALVTAAGIVEQHKVVPRRHNVHLFAMLEELLPEGNLRAAGVDAIAYGCGPGSFTGLRIAASFAQGLAFSSAIPAIPLETLGIMAQGALREGLAQPGEAVLVTLDARINELYAGLYEFREGVAVALSAPWVCAPGELALHDVHNVVAVGSGCRYRPDFPPELLGQVTAWHEQLLPRAIDMPVLAQAALENGLAVSSDAILPVYVQEEISWKKLAEQGPQA